MACIPNICWELKESVVPSCLTHSFGPLRSITHILSSKDKTELKGKKENSSSLAAITIGMSVKERNSEVNAISWYLRDRSE